MSLDAGVAGSQLPPPAVIVGAPRSGTKILRDTLADFPGHTTWPCDEIPAIWKHGNLDVPHDELTADRATPDVRDFIRSEFAKRARTDAADVVVEKTCANALRVPFVDAVLPEARYVHIVRDGRDAAPSAMKRWTGDTSLRYTLRKARFVPPTDVPRYALDWVGNRLNRLVSETNRVGVWGPRFEGLEEVARERPLVETCALQWTRCVESATRDLEDVGSGKVHTVYYEDLVTEPVAAISDLAGFLGADLSKERIQDLAEPVHAGSVGKGRDDLDADDLDRIEAIMADALETHGYH